MQHPAYNEPSATAPHLQELINRVFPEGDVALRRSSGFEVNGLPKGTQPQGCEILARGLEPDSRGDRREHYLVRVDAVMLFFRICTAMEGSGYDEFVAGRGIAVTYEEQVELRNYAEGWIESMCKPH